WTASSTGGLSWTRSGTYRCIRSPVGFVPKSVTSVNAAADAGGPTSTASAAASAATSTPRALTRTTASCSRAARRPPLCGRPPDADKKPSTGSTRRRERGANGAADCQAFHAPPLSRRPGAWGLRGGRAVQGTGGDGCDRLYGEGPADLAGEAGRRAEHGPYGPGL